MFDARPCARPLGGPSRARPAKGLCELIRAIYWGVVADRQLYIWHDRFLYATPSVASGATSRYAAAILIATRGKPFAIDTGNPEGGRFEAVLLAPSLERTLDATDCGLISLNLDPESYEYHALQGLFRTRSVVPLAIDNFSSFRSRFGDLFSGNLSCGLAFLLFTEVVATIADYRPSNVHVDLRVLHVARRLKAELPEMVSVADLAANVGLSADRLTHLFTEEFGLSIRRYALWAKMRRAAVLLGKEKSLTEVAQQVGFSDSSHLSRTFQQFFGLAPSFLANGRCVRIHVCET